MTITRQTSYDYQVSECGNIHVRKIKRVFEDGTEIAKKFHRHVVHKDDDISGEDPMTQRLAVALRNIVDAERTMPRVTVDTTDDSESMDIKEYKKLADDEVIFPKSLGFDPANDPGHDLHGDDAHALHEEKGKETFWVKVKNFFNPMEGA